MTTNVVPLADLTLHIDVSAVLLNNLMDDDQPESRTLMLRTLVFSRVKWIEDMFEICW